MAALKRMGEPGVNEAGDARAPDKKRSTSRQRSAAGLVQVATTGWTYSQDTDRMRGTVLSVAQLSSIETAETPFSDTGAARGVISLRKLGGFRQATFQITNGRFSMLADRHKLFTKADARPIQAWQASLSSDNDFSKVTVRQVAPFVRILSGAGVFIIEAELHGVGRRQFLFEPTGLDPSFFS